jgi:hypothetical protein
MRYFRLIDDLTIPGRWHLGAMECRLGQALPDFLTDEPLPTNLGLHVAITEPGRALDFCLNGFAVPIARFELLSAIASHAGSSIQKLDVKVDRSTVRADFLIVHALSSIDCLDETRSEYVKWTTADHRADLSGQYRMVTRLEIDTSKVPRNSNIFRIKKWPIALIVSESMKSTIEGTEHVGAAFQDVS